MKSDAATPDPSASEHDMSPHQMPDSPILPQSIMKNQALQLRTITGISRIISPISYLNKLLSTTVDIIRDRFKLYRVVLFLLEENGYCALLKAEAGEGLDNHLHTGVMTDKTHCRIDCNGTSALNRSLQDCQVHITKYEEGSTERSVLQYLGPRTRSEMALPLSFKDMTIGVISLQSDNPSSFSSEDIPVFQILGEIVSNAIENARGFELMADARCHAESRLHEMQIMQRISSAVTGTFNLDNVLDALFSALSNEMGFTSISVNIIDDNSREMRTIRSVGLAQKRQGIAWPLDKLTDSIIGDIIESGRIKVVNGRIEQFDTGIYDPIVQTGLIRVFVPLLSRGKSIGILAAGYTTSQRPAIMNEELQLLNGLAEQVAITVENTRLILQLNHERDLLHTLMENIPDAIYFKDNKSQFIRASRALALKNGLSDPRELLGKTDFDLFTKEHAQQAFDDEQRILQTATPEIDIEEKETWQDSRITWVSTTKMPLRDNSGHIIGTFGVSRDITKRKEIEDALKHAEEQLRQANSVLEQRVTERTEDLKQSNELLKSHIEQLNFLNSSVYELSPITAIDSLLPAILHIFMIRFPRMEGGLCFRSDDDFHCICTTGRLDNEQGRTCLEEAARYIAEPEFLKPIFIEDRTTDERLSSIPWSGIDDLPCIIAIPLVVDNTCKVILHLATTPYYAGTFAIEQTLLTTLAAHAAICLSNAIYYKESAEKARIDGELDAARTIQRRFTPQHRPAIPHLNLTGIYYPAYQVGGDYLDYFQTEDGDWVIAIADVCGKGIPAALLMTTMRSAFRIEAKKEKSARRLLCSINKFMVHNLDDKSFVTALCLIVDKDGSQMSYARAGHPLLLKLDHQGTQPENIVCRGPALGLIHETHVFEEMTEEKCIPLVAGDRFLVYTDGLIDAADQQKNAYGFGRLRSLLSQDRSSDPEHLIDTIIGDIKDFTNDAPFNDDLTILAFQVF